MAGGFKVHRLRVITKPTNTVAPAITGIATTGQTVSADNGTWANLPTSFAGAWERNGSPIGGATASTYVLQVADEHQNITFQVTASNLAGGTTATSNTIVPTASGSVPVLAPSGAWNGTPGTGYAGSPPVDPTRTTAKPGLRMASAWGARISGSTYRIYVDAEALGAQPGSLFGIAACNGYLEGGVGAGVFGKYTYPHPVTAVSVTIQGYAFDINVAACVAAHGTGGVDFYAEAIPKDWDGSGGTMQKRVIGPFRFYPRATQYSNTFTIGSGGTYATRKLAIAAAVAANEEAPRLHYVTSGTYEAEDCSAYGGYMGTKGFWVEDCANGVAATISRAVFPVGQDDGAAFWDPGPDGIEWGPGITLDPRNWSFIVNHNQVLGDGLRHGHRINGGLVINSEGTLNSFYWNGRPRAPGLWSAPGFLEDCNIEWLIAGSGTTFLGRNVGIEGNLREAAPNCYYQQHVYLKGWDAYTFWFQINVMHLSYSGTGVGRMWITNFQSSSAVLHFSVDNVETHTITLGWLSNQANFSTTQVVATINAFADGWAASVILDGPGACFMGGVNISPTSDAGSTPTVVGNAGSPSLVRADYDFHQDYWHSISQTAVSGPYTTSPSEGTILRDVTVIGETVQPQNLVVPAFTRIDTTTSDLMILDCSFRMVFGTDASGISKNHVFMRGVDFAREGWTPSPGWDSYSRFEASVCSIFWAAGTISWPAFVNCYVPQTNGSNAAAALAPPQHTGNTVVAATDFNSMLVANRALFVNVDTADFRDDPANILPSHLVTRSEPFDAADNAFAVPDVIGSMASGQSARTWPF